MALPPAANLDLAGAEADGEVGDEGVLGLAWPLAEGSGARSHCRFVRPHIRFAPDSITYSVSLFLKRKRDRILSIVVSMIDRTHNVTEPYEGAFPCRPRHAASGSGSEGRKEKEEARGKNDTASAWAGLARAVAGHHAPLRLLRHRHLPQGVGTRHARAVFDGPRRASCF
jgi:hypothetical protein